MMYLTLKALHIFFVLLWVSGMIVQALLLWAGRKLPGVALPQEVARLRILHKWERTLTTPAMVLALGSGLLIAMEGDWFGNAWLTTKIGIALLLTGVHGIQAGKLRRMVSTGGGGVGFDAMNMLPIIIGAPFVIIFLVIFKPF